MYGRLFESTFTGSMFGAGMNVFAVWGYILAHTRADSTLEVNPRLVAAILGCQRHDVESALEYLQKPDPDSRTPDEDGKRLVREGEYQYRVVNYQRYRSIRNDEERKEYNRDAQRRHRMKERESSSSSLTVNESSDDTPLSSRVSAHTDAATDTDTDTEECTLPVATPHTETEEVAPRKGVERGTSIRSPDGEARDQEEEITGDQTLTLTGEDAEPDPLPRSQPQVDYQAVAEAWNEVCGGVCPRVSQMTDARRAVIRQRWKELGGLEGIKGLFKRASASSFLMGGGDKGWVAGFDWVMGRRHSVRILEGNHDDRPAGRPRQARSVGQCQTESYDAEVRKRNERKGMEAQHEQ